MKNIIFILTILLIPIGILLRLYDIVGGNILLTLGFLGLLIFYVKRTISGFQNKVSKKIIVLNILLVLMSFCLFTKYLYHIFGDYPTLIILPIFIISALVYLITEREKQTKLTIVTLLYLILTIPLFGFEFNESPRPYIPQSWYDRYGEPKSYFKSIPFEFELPETKKLNDKGNDLKNQQLYSDAIKVYEKGRKLEPKNLSLLFELSEAHAKINELETAIALLDTAISINPNYPEFYNNRGLLYYKIRKDNEAIEDYNRGIKLDSTQSSFYANLAMVYYYQDSLEIACSKIKKAESLGLEITDFKLLREIKQEHCE
ncbi:tetratricopeptide repeat protein [Winogradskyella sp. Asnod2-B02-A]|uniref:tetratricopeptide repeat protein n=1 Tax=Winogradskyella sp. Asnod2-B02-A TaxID=3160583 RepID=UPI003863C20E